jgi:energy-coupling factor transport system permease protein
MPPAVQEINAVAWLAWFAGAAMLPLVTRNPLYLALTLAAVMVVHLALPAQRGAAGAWRLFAYTGSVVAAVSIGFNVLTVHVGDRVFAELPDWLPIIGGPLTVNALVYGICSALAISTLLFAAATFNSAVRHADLIRLLPRSFAQLGLAGSIAISFVPQLMAAGRDIYDAQRARGVQFRNARDATGLLLPLLATGMERAVALSEALETRGFGYRASAVRPGKRRPLLLGVAVVLLLGALALLSLGQLLPGALVLTAASMAALAAVPPGTRRSRYRPLTWNLRSCFVAASALGPVLLFITNLSGALDLRFEPFPRLTAPEFSPLAVLVLGLLAPVWRPHR